MVKYPGRVGEHNIMVSQRNIEGSSPTSPAGIRPTAASLTRQQSTSGHTENHFPTEMRLEQSNSNTMQQPETEDDINLDDICEVVVSLKCKQCQFLCHDKRTLANHIRCVHSTTIASKNVSDRKKTFQKAAAGALDKGNVISFSGSTSIKGSSSENAKELSRDSRTRSESSQEIKPSSISGSVTPIQGDKTIDSISSNVDTSGSTVDESIDSCDVFLCAECDIVFSSREMCCSHMHKVHGLKQFSADFIQEEIISKPVQDSQSSKIRKTKLPKQFTPASGTIVSKKYRVTKDVFHTCSKCPIKFESAEVKKFHEQCHLPGSTKSSKAPSKKIQALGDEGEEGQASNGQKGFLCPVCGSNGKRPCLFPKWNRCAWHLWKDHRIDCELYTCSVCKQFKSYFIARVKDHEQLHSIKANYKCKICNKTFKQLKQLRCHEKYHKDNSTKLAPVADSRWYTPKECHICRRILSDSKCLKKHISAVHNKLKPYVCNICGHTSARKAELQLHHRQHTGEKPYKCPNCPFQTGDHNSLRKHKLRHSDERPYACPYCDYRCIQSCAFKKHLLTSHPGQEVVYVCQICSHASVNEALFIAHKKAHSEGRIKMDKQNEMENASKSPLPMDGTNEKFWSGDDNSVDIVDNGGVTIPASPQLSQNKDTPLNAGIIEVKRGAPGESLPQRSTESSTVINETVVKSSESHIEKLVPLKGSRPPPSLIVLKKEQSIYKRSKRVRVTGKCGEKIVTLSPHLPAATSQIYSVTASLQTSPPPRPVSGSNGPASISNCLGSSQTDMRGHGEDTESSSSEVITNPHQLIQNIQLTPLDLTDIIAFNEQSNDDGMLQRLLDMSGV